MKNIYFKYIVLLALVAISFGCKKFLKESSQDELRPSSAEDLQQLLVGEVYPTYRNFLKYIDLMTDDVSSNFMKDDAKLEKLYNGEPVFTWKKDMFESMQERSVPGVDTYEHYYRRIKGCNVVLDMIGKVSGTESEKANVKGQALAMRAYYYFMLVNVFAKPYNGEGVDVNATLGVPLLIESKVEDEHPARATIGAVYNQIEKDLLEAAPYLDQYGQKNSKFKATNLFAYTLLSRMYLYMENWEQSLAFANKVLERNDKLLKLSNIPIPPNANAATANVFDFKSPECIWVFSSSDEIRFNPFFIAPAYGDLPMYEVSQELHDLYEHNWGSGAADRKDLRPAFFYNRYYISKTTYDVKLLLGSKVGGDPYMVKGMRVAESYLNRAESNIQIFIKTGNDANRLAALEDLNNLRFYRYDTRNAAYIPVDIADGQTLLEFCRDERRRELSFEEHRWFDLKRYGMPEIKHTFQGVENQTPIEYILKKGDDRYVLPLPQTALQKNPSLIPNP